MSSKFQATPVMAPKPWPFSPPSSLKGEMGDFPLAASPGPAPTSALTPVEPVANPVKPAKAPPPVHPVSLTLKEIAVQEKALDKEIEGFQREIKTLEAEILKTELRKRDLYEPFYETIKKVSERLNELYTSLEYAEMPVVDGIGPDENWEDLGESEFLTNAKLDNPRKKYPSITMEIHRVNRYDDLIEEGSIRFDADIFTPEGFTKFEKECNEAVAEDERVKQEVLEEERREEERRREQERIRAEERKQREAAQKEKEKKEAAKRAEQERERERKEYERLRKKFEVPVSLF